MLSGILKSLAKPVQPQAPTGLRIFNDLLTNEILDPVALEKALNAANFNWNEVIPKGVYQGQPILTAVLKYIEKNSTQPALNALPKLVAKNGIRWNAAQLSCIVNIAINAERTFIISNKSIRAEPKIPSEQFADRPEQRAYYSFLENPQNFGLSYSDQIAIPVHGTAVSVTLAQYLINAAHWGDVRAQKLIPKMLNNKDIDWNNKIDPYGYFGDKKSDYRTYAFVVVNSLVSIQDFDALEKFVKMDNIEWFNYAEPTKYEFNEHNKEQPTPWQRNPSVSKPFYALMNAADQSPSAMASLYWVLSQLSTDANSSKFYQFSSREPLLSLLKKSHERVSALYRQRQSNGSNQNDAAYERAINGMEILAQIATFARHNSAAWTMLRFFEDIQDKEKSTRWAERWAKSLSDKDPCFHNAWVDVAKRLEASVRPVMQYQSHVEPRCSTPY